MLDIVWELWRAWKMLQTELLVANLRVDKAENMTVKLKLQRFWLSWWTFVEWSHWQHRQHGLIQGHKVSIARSLPRTLASSLASSLAWTRSRICWRESVLSRMRNGSREVRADCREWVQTSKSVTEPAITPLKSLLCLAKVVAHSFFDFCF